MTGRELIQKFIDNGWYNGTLEEGLSHLDNWIECPRYSYLQGPDREIDEFDAGNPDEIIVFQEYLDSLVPSTWGGSRPGAGRKSTGRKACQFYITEDEKMLLKKYLDELRG